MDHAQSEEEIIAASAYPFDSIMVDMSHYEKAENLEKTRRITKILHEKGIATEVEPGRINGGGDGVKDTGDLEGLHTTAEEAQELVDTGIDFLAPAFGNVHGSYGEIENIKLDFLRYAYDYVFVKLGLGVVKGLVGSNNPRTEAGIYHGLQWERTLRPDCSCSGRRDVNCWSWDLSLPLFRVGGTVVLHKTMMLFRSSAHHVSKPLQETY